MELIIKISEEAYERHKAYRNTFKLSEAIANGIPLPKGHGRLIDADTCRKDMMNSRDFEFFKILDMQTTIVEADEENDNGSSNQDT